MAAPGAASALLHQLDVIAALLVIHAHRCAQWLPHEPQLYRGLDIGDPVRFTLKGVPPNLSITAIAREDKP